MTELSNLHEQSTMCLDSITESGSLSIQSVTHLRQNCLTYAVKRGERYALTEGLLNVQPVLLNSSGLLAQFSLLLALIEGWISKEISVEHKSL